MGGSSSTSNAPDRERPEGPEPTEQLSTSLGAFDLLADEAAGSGLVAALVWVFALDWISGYETDVFNNPFENNTDDQYQKKMHGAFVGFIAITAGAGCFGVMLLTFYYNVVKLVGFQSQKTGELTREKTRAAAEMVVSLDGVTYFGRVLGVAVAFPTFMIAAVIYLWSKVRNLEALGEDTAKDQAIVVTVIISLFTAAGCAAFLWVTMKYIKFKEAVTGTSFESEKDGEQWYNRAFS